MNRRQQNRGGFTLVELLTVICIMAVMMSITIGAYIDFGRGAGMRGSVLNVQSALSNARQWAITKRTRTTMTYGNTPTKGYFYIMDGSSNLLGNTNYLAENVYFSNSATPTVVFKIDGSCPGTTRRQIGMTESNRATPLVEVIEILPLTGRVRIKEVESSSSGGGDRT